MNATSKFSLVILSVAKNPTFTGALEMFRQAQHDSFRLLCPFAYLAAK